MTGKNILNSKIKFHKKILIPFLPALPAWLCLAAADRAQSRRGASFEGCPAFAERLDWGCFGTAFR
jgi:hypothetical protein